MILDRACQEKVKIDLGSLLQNSFLTKSDQILSAGCDKKICPKPHFATGC